VSPRLPLPNSPPFRNEEVVIAAGSKAASSKTHSASLDAEAIGRRIIMILPTKKEIGKLVLRPFSCRVGEIAQ
jgi:hypothetical protein